MRTFRDVKRVVESGLPKAIITWEDDVLGIYHVGVDDPPVGDLTQWAKDYMVAWVPSPPAPPMPDPILAKIAALDLTESVKDVLREMAGHR